MVGVVWFVQVVHYPLFGKVGAQGFRDYSQTHSRLSGYVVGPPMLAEMATAVALLISQPAGVPEYLPWAGGALLAVVWGSTALLQVPRHHRLGSGYDRATHRALVATNWLRTVAWSLRGFLALWMLAAVTG